MANHPHHDDDQAKKKPGSGATPKQPPVPNMSLDDDESFLVEEAMEAEVIPLEEAAPEDALPVVEAAPESDIVAADPFEDDAAALLAEEDVVEEIAEAAPASDVLLSEENPAAAHAETPEPRAHRAHPASDAKPLAAAPESEVNLAELFGDAYAPPASGAAPKSAAPPKPPADADSLAAEEYDDVIEEVAEAEPVAAEDDDVIEEVAEAEPVTAEDDDVIEAEPASAVLAAEDEIEEAEPISAVLEADEVVDEADASDVLADEEAAAIEPSEMNSGELAEEVIEMVEDDEPASAIAVQDDDDPFGATEFADAAPLKSPDSSVLAAEPVHFGSSAVLFGEVVEEIGKKKTSAKASFDKTVAFDAPPSGGKRKGEPDSLVTEEEVIGEAEPASAITFGEGSGRKSSATGIDEVAEALESGVGLDSSELANTALPEPSVEFDEILDEDEGIAPKSSKKKKAKAVVDEDEAEAAETLDDEAAEIFDLDDEPVSSVKKSKAKIKATGDDIDLDDIFSEAEAAEAVEDKTADADEAEATEAMDDDADEAFAAAAAEDDEDDAPKKKKAVAKGADDDEEAAEAADLDEDEDDDASAKKKKGKNGEKATVAPQAQGSGAAMRWAGRFFLLCLGMFVVLGGVLAGLMFAGGSVTPLLFTFADEAARKDAAESIYKTKTPPAPPKVDGRTQLDKLREALAKGEYDEIAKETEASTDEAELDVRGQAKWLAYLKQAGKKLDKAAPLVKEAKEDLAKAKNVALIGQIEGLLNSGDNAGEIVKLKTLEAVARADKAKSDKALDSLADVLVKGDYLKDKTMLTPPALAKILQTLGEDRTALEAFNKILTDAKYKDGEEGLKTLLKEKKGAEDSVAAINKVLDNEKTKDKGDKGVLELADARNKAAAGLTNVTKDRDEVLATIKKAYEELLTGKGDDKADPRKELIKAAMQARLKSESPLAAPLTQLGIALGNIATGTSKTVEQAFAMNQVFAELGFYRAREEFIQTPQQKMDTYIALLQDRKENNAKALNAIVTEAAWVLAPDSKSTPEQQAKALYVKGLALRNQEKFAEAKSAFADALKQIDMVPIDKAVWTQLARQSQKELVDPNAYFLPRAERFQSEGNLKAAMNEIDTGVKAMPDAPRLFAQRGLLRYELSRRQGAKVAETVQKSIRADAEIAGKDDALRAESQYILGLLEEQLGNVGEAEKLFRSAIKTHADIKSSIDDAGKYRIALGRLLLGDRVPAIAPPPTDDKKGEEKKADEKAAAPAGAERVLVLHPWTPLIVSALIAQPGGDDIEDKAVAARLNETVMLANELIASANPKIKGQGYLLLGSAHSKQGRRTDGLKEYSKGLQLLYPGIPTAEMTKLIDEHPAFQQPDTTASPNPVLAERHFGDGMHFFWSQQYPEAEKQFRQAVKYYDKDARYQYYLGLAQINQKTQTKRDSGIYAFEQGARLEARTVATNPLAARDINASLERIQGPLRELLNSYRYKASEEAETPPKKGL